MKRYRQFQKNFTSLESIQKTIERMLSENHIDVLQKDYLKENIEIQFEDVRYILKNLSAHVFIGIVFAFDLIPLPLGTISRVIWVIINRLNYSIINYDPQKLKVHNLKVLFFSAIPWVGYFSYLLPIIQIDKTMLKLYTNHICYQLKNKSYTAYMMDCPIIIQKLSKRIINL